MRGLELDRSAGVAGARQVAAALALAAAAAWPAAAVAGPATVGDRFEVRADDLPAPYASESVSNAPARIRHPAGAGPAVPEGFRVNVFADGLDHPRWLAVTENGDVLLAEPRAGRVTLLRVGDGDGEAELVETFATGLQHPHGLAVRGEHLYVADVERVWRYRLRRGQTRATGNPEAVTRRGAFGSSGGHWTRNLVFSPDGRRFFVAIG